MRGMKTEKVREDKWFGRFGRRVSQEAISMVDRALQLYTSLE